jgi:hypothetical protein
MADYKPKQFFGAAQTVFNYTTADITAGNFSPAGTDFDNTSDASVPYADHAICMLECDYATAPTAGQTVELWALPLNVDGTDDVTDAPSGTASGGAIYLCSWMLAATTTLQRRWAVCSLAGITGFTPYVKNGSSTAMDCDGGTSGLVVKITPFVVGATG